MGISVFPSEYMASLFPSVTSTKKSSDTHLGPEAEIVSLSFDELCGRFQALCSRLTATLLQDEILESSKINNLRNSLIAQFPESHQSTLSRLFVYDDVKLSTSLLSTERRSTVGTVSMLLAHVSTCSICITTTSYAPIPRPGGDDPGWDRNR